MKSTSNFFKCLLAGLLIAVCAPSLSWGYFVQAEGSASVRGGNASFVTQSEDTGQVFADSVTMTNINISDSDGGPSIAWADVRAEASLGQLRLHAEYYAYRYGGTPGSVGTAQSTVRWEDTLTITSDTLPIGAVVTLRASLDLTGSLTEVIDGNAIGNGIIRSVASGGNAFDSYYLRIEESENAPGVRILTDTFTSRVGDTFSINGYLYGYVGGDAISGGSSHLTADFFSTSKFTLESLTDGAGYITESGVSYSAVPLPGSAALLAAALLALSATRRRKGV